MTHSIRHCLSVLVGPNIRPTFRPSLTTHGPHVLASLQFPLLLISSSFFSRRSSHFLLSVSLHHFYSLCSGRDSSAPRPCPRPLLSLWQSGACWSGSFLMHGVRRVVPSPLHLNSFDKRITVAGIVELPHMIYPGGTTNSIHQTGRQSFWTWNKNMQTSRLVCPD